jgi:hypothetical protein
MCPIPPAPRRSGQAQSFRDAGTEVGVRLGPVFVDGAFLDEPLHPIAEVRDDVGHQMLPIGRRQMVRHYVFSDSRLGQEAQVRSVWLGDTP